MPTRPLLLPATAGGTPSAVHRTNRRPLLESWFLPELPGPGTLAAHVLRTGSGGYWTDRRQAPNAALVHCGPYRVLRGDPRFLTPERLAPFERGQFSVLDRFLPLLGRTFTTVMPWVRVVCVQEHRTRRRALPTGVRLRPLTPADAAGLDALDPELRWITETWRSSRALAAAGGSWGAFVEGRLVSLSVCYLRGSVFEDVAVVTLPEFRRSGLALACVRAVTTAIRRRGRVPTWTVPRSNEPSRALAAAAGFVPVREELAYWAGPAL